MNGGNRASHPIRVMFYFGFLLVLGLISPALLGSASHTTTPSPLATERILAAPPASILPHRLGTYWLNFSILDTSGATIVTFGFQFYVSANSTEEISGIDQLPIAVTEQSNGPTGLFTELPKLNYSQFVHISGLYESYTFTNGSKACCANDVYSPPTPNYYVLSSCSFPCITRGGYISINSSGPGPVVDSGYGFVLGASDLHIVYLDNSNYSLPGLSISINMTISNAATRPIFTPAVTITGAHYSVTNGSSFQDYQISTGVGYIFTPLFYVLIAVVPAVALTIIGGTIWRKRQHRQPSPSAKVGDSGRAPFASVRRAADSLN